MGEIPWTSCLGSDVGEMPLRFVRVPQHLRADRILTLVLRISIGCALAGLSPSRRCSSCAPRCSRRSCWTACQRRRHSDPGQVGSNGPLARVVSFSHALTWLLAVHFYSFLVRHGPFRHPGVRQYSIKPRSSPVEWLVEMPLAN